MRISVYRRWMIILVALCGTACGTGGDDAVAHRAGGEPEMEVLHRGNGSEPKTLDLVHVHYAIPHTVAALLVKEILGRDLPVVTTLHGTDITLVGSHSDFYDLTRYAIQRSDAVTADSN